MRIHGDKIVTRRSVVEKRTPYGEYLDILREDFAGICGYCGKTAAGRYMVQVGFEFDKRPMREIYKALQLIDKKQQLRKKMQNVSDDEFHEYIEVDQLLEQLQQTLFTKKE